MSDDVQRGAKGGDTPESNARRWAANKTKVIPDEEGGNVEVCVTYSFGEPRVTIETQDGDDITVAGLSEANARKVVEAVEECFGEIRAWREKWAAKEANP